MDEAGRTHYVPPTCILPGGSKLTLLLFISALLTSLTGAITGTRAAEVRQVEASADYGQAAVEVAVEVAQVVAATIAPQDVRSRQAAALWDDFALPSRASEFERLLE